MRTMICVSGCGVLSVLLFVVSGTSADRVSRQIYKGVRCALPEHPEHGQWQVLNGHGSPGDIIEFGTVIQFTCNDRYKLRGKTSYVVCTRDFNPYLLPRCARVCPPMYSTSTTTLRCVDENNLDVDCSEATDGSYMTYTCIPFYEPPIGFRRNILCLDGYWNYPKPVCQPVCGKKIADDKAPLIYGGTVLKPIEYPWIAAIFIRDDDGFTNVCGGSLISRRVILTAAHCLTDGNGVKLPPQEFLVGVGKLYNKYNDQREEKAQYLEAMRIVTRRGYKGPRRNYIEDIGLVITRQPVTLSNVVQPVCIPDMGTMHLRVGHIGEIAGWGAKEDGQVSDVLRKLEIPYKDQTQCAEELNHHEDFAEKYNLIDKMCAGFYNRNISVCRGDSGSGLVFRNPNENRYYIHGIVSIGPSKKGKCSINQNALYTRVPFYYDFIDKEITKNYREDCTLPAYPENGYWSIESDNKIFPGDIVSSSTTLRVYCRDGYDIDGNSFISCESAVNMPTCNVRCEPLDFPPRTRVTCQNKNGRQIDCQSANEGSTVQYHCLGNNGNYRPQQLRKCVNGSWGSPTPACPQIQLTQAVIGNPVVPLSSLPVARPEGPKVFCTYDSFYFPKQLLPEDLDTSLCTHLVCSFTATYNGSDPNWLFDNQPRFYDIGTSKGLFGRMTDLKKTNGNLKVILSIQGSRSGPVDPFSVTSANDNTVDDFVDRAVSVLRSYNFDGLIIDWHNPAVNETEKYVRFITRANKKVKENKYLFPISVGSVLNNTGYDAETIAKYADWVIVKTYDFYGSWSAHTGLNSPLYSSSKDGDWERNNYNVNASVTNWLNAGISEDKLIMSIPFRTRPVSLKNSSQHEVHSPISKTGPAPVALELAKICLEYSHYTEAWDNEQKTPYKYNDNHWFGYENEESLRLKAQYIKDNNLAGVNINPINGDDVYGKCKDKYHYLKYVRMVLGLN